jgi:oligopeptide/dipeptide ABC transporter ATP-binding protein
LPRLDRPDRELMPIGGVPPRLREEPAGCAFAPRCQYAIDSCRDIEPTLELVEDSMVACAVQPFSARAQGGSR